MWNNQQDLHHYQQHYQHQYPHLHLYPPRNSVKARQARVSRRVRGNRIWLGASATPNVRLTDRRRGLRPPVPECQTAAGTASRYMQYI